MRLRNSFWLFLAVAAACPTGPASGEVLYPGSGGDLADPATWGLSAFPATDWYKIDGEAATFPSAGFSLSGDLPTSGRITLQYFPARTVGLSAGGHSLNCDNLLIKDMHRADNDRFNPLQVTGGFSGLKQLTVDTKCNLELYDGIYAVDSVKAYNWFPTLVVGSGAELVVGLFKANQQVFIDGNASYPSLCVRDGGVFRIAARDAGVDKNWMCAEYKSYSERAGHFEILNGGAYIDDSDWPSDLFAGNMSVRIDGGSYLATNSTHAARCTRWGSVRGATFALTNGTMRLSHFYCGHCNGDGFGNWDTGSNPVGTRLTFHNSTETLKYPDWYREQHPDYPAGLGFGPYAADNELVIDGASNAFSADRVLFGGTNNAIVVAGGTFDLSDTFLFRAGESNRVSFTGGRVQLTNLAVGEGVRNASLTISGDAEVEIVGPQSGNYTIFRRLPICGEGGRIEASGRIFSVGDSYLDFNRDGNELRVTGGVSTGDVWFAANDCTAFFGDGVHHTAIRPTVWRSTSAIQTLRFEPGTSGNRLVLSNATYRCEKPFLSGYLVTSEGPEMEARPFTGCPGSCIEFRGDHPKFLVTSGVPNPNSGAAWFAFALGEMIDETPTEYTDKGTGDKSMRPYGWKTERYLLDDPVRLRFVLPTGGYEEAPFQNTGTCGVLGGNAEFEFDLSSFKWPSRQLRIPLVYDKNAYTGWGDRSYVDLEGLNLANAGSLPVYRRGSLVARSRLELSADGTTLELVMSGNMGTVLIVR